MSASRPGPLSTTFLPRLLTASLRWTLMGLVYLVVASTVLNASMRCSWRGGLGKIFDELISYEAPRPFAFRVLTPLMINSMTVALPERVRAAITRVDADDGLSRVGRARAAYGWPGGNDVARYMCYVLLLVGLIATAMVWRTLVRRHCSGSELLGDYVPALGLLLLPMTFLKGGYIYDIPELFYVSACLVFFLSGRWKLYYVMFTLAVLNKESDVLLASWCVGRYVIDRDWRRLARHGLIHLAIAGPLLVGTRLLFASNPGSNVEVHFLENLDFLTSPESFFSFRKWYAETIPVPAGFNVVNLFLGGTLVFLGWKRKPRAVRMVFASSVLTLLPFFLVAGWRDEIRVFAMAFPSFLLLSVHTITRVYSGGAPPTPGVTGEVRLSGVEPQ